MTAGNSRPDPCKQTPSYLDDEEYFDGDEGDDDVFETMDDTPVQVQPGLFIGSFLAEQNKAKLLHAGITHILMAAEGLEPSHPSDFVYLTLAVQDAPSEDLVAHFPRALAFIDTALAHEPGSSAGQSAPAAQARSDVAAAADGDGANGAACSTSGSHAAAAASSPVAAGRRGAVLVHCVAGVSRSATIVIGWLMRAHGITYDDAFRRLHAVRPWIMPNIGFRHQLAEFHRLGYDTSKYTEQRRQP